MKEIYNSRQGIIITGAATREMTFKLPENTTHQADTVLTAHEHEDTFGGAGVCNAIAFAQTGLTDNVVFFTPVGTTENNPDSDALHLYEQLSERKVRTHFQLHEGSTEKTVVILSGSNTDHKRGFRFAAKDGSILRNSFLVDDQLTKLLQENPIAVGSSFSAKHIINISRAFKSYHGGDGLFIWTINKDSAREISQCGEIQNAIRGGMIDIMCMSENEKITLTENSKSSHSLDSIALEVVTRGEDGCQITDRTQDLPKVHHIPAFDEIHHVINDNGAGEAHHANFIATYLSCQNFIGADENFRARVLQTAGHIANLAGYIKIQQSESLWFPSLNYELIVKEVLAEEHSPRKIAEITFNEYNRSKFNYE